MIHFFRASSWSLDSIRSRWLSVVKEYSPLYGEGNFHVLVADGVKQFKEGRRMPGIKKLFQESENSAKPQYMHGHMFGRLGILADSTGSWTCSIGIYSIARKSRPYSGGRVWVESTKK